MTKKKYHTQKRKRKLKKSILKPLLLIVLILIIGLILLIFIKDDKKNNGFNLTFGNNDEISNIGIVVKLIQEEEYINENLEKYLTYVRQYNSPIYHTIVIVNNNLESIAYNETIASFIDHKDFISTNLKRYLDYYEKYSLSIDKTILAVNNGLDKDDIELNDTVESFMKQKYFVSDNLKRYLNYYKKNSKLELKEVVTRVNSNLDRPFYEDVIKADLSKGNLILVNKYYYLSSSYVPDNLVNVSSKHGTGTLNKDVYTAYQKMYNDAKKEGLNLYISSPYRSYSRQNTLYTNYAKRDGKSEADTYSARPGYSEHQTGLAFDLGTASNHSITEFENSDEFKWTKKNAHKYGFILRYPKGKTYITGYIYEPWHYRYVGVEVATYIYENDITYEEYYEYFVK